MTERVRLGDLISLQRGTSYKGALVGSPGIPLLGLGTINRNGGFRRENVRQYGGDSPEKISARAGDIYVSLKDVTHAADLLGAAARVPDDIPFGRLTQDTVRVDLKSDAVDTGYLYAALLAPDYRRYCRVRGTGTTNLDLSREDFYAFTVRLPSLMEQRAISEVLSALDDKIAANINVERLVADLLEKESASRWFDLEVSQSDLVLATDYFDIGVSSGDWGTVRGQAFMEMKNVPESGFGMTTWVERESATGPRFVNGDTLVARITPCLENRKTGFVDFLADGESAAGSTELVVVRSKQPLAPPMSYLFAVSDAFRSYAIRHMSGTSGRQRVAAKDLRQFPMPKPDLGWLSEFGLRSIALFEQSRSLRQEASTLTQMRDTLLPALISGTLRVRDAEKAVEEVL